MSLISSNKYVTLYEEYKVGRSTREVNKSDDYLNFCERQKTCESCKINLKTNGELWSSIQCGWVYEDYKDLLENEANETDEAFEKILKRCKDLEERVSELEEVISKISDCF